MKRLIYNSGSVILWLSAVVTCLAASPSRLQSLVNSAASVIVAQIDSTSFDGSVHRVQLHVVSSAKGPLLPGTTVSADFKPLGPEKAARVSGPPPQGNVLLFMNQDASGSWHLAPLGFPALGLSGAYFKIPGNALANASQAKSTTPFDAVI